MKIDIVVNGKTIPAEIDEKDAVEVGIVERSNKTGYEKPEENDNCYIVFGDSSIDKRLWGEVSDDNEYYENANAFLTEKLAKDNARADRLMRQLRRYAATHEGIPSVQDSDIYKEKYCICYDNNFCRLFIDKTYSNRDFGQIYFNAHGAAKSAIKEFKDELTWYFTEYEPQLRG